MNKKILISSIIAVAILIGVSFTSVIGYNSVKSTSALNSPLFDVRTSRAIDEESKGMVYDYVGKGEESVLLIPKRDDKTTIKQKVADMIYTMDDITFNKLMNLVASKFQQKEKRNEVINNFHQLKNHPERISVDYDNNNGNFTSKTFICLFLKGIFWLTILSILVIITDITAFLTIALCDTTWPVPYCLL